MWTFNPEHKLQQIFPYNYKLMKFVQSLTFRTLCFHKKILQSTYWYTFWILSSNFFTLSFPFFKRMFFFVLKLHFNHQNLSLSKNIIVTSVCLLLVMTQKQSIPTTEHCTSQFKNLSKLKDNVVYIYAH